MTTINFIWLAVAGIFLAAGSWGLGKSRGTPEPGYRVLSMELRHDAVPLVSKAGTGPPVAAARTAGDEVTMETVRGKFDELAGLAKITLPFEVFADKPEALAQALPDPDKINALKEILRNPETRFVVKGLTDEQLHKLLTPRDGESFQIPMAGKEIGFVWLDGVKCWFSAEEMQSPPGTVSFGEGGSATCKSPTEAQWLAARQAANDGGAAIQMLDSGQGEYLRDNRNVIGRSTWATDTKWDAAVDVARRTAETRMVTPPPQITPDDARRDPRFANLTNIQKMSDTGGLLRQIQQDLQKKANDAAAATAAKETFSYRWVIESPLP